MHFMIIDTFEIIDFISGLAVTIFKLRQMLWRHYTGIVRASEEAKVAKAVQRTTRKLVLQCYTRFVLDILYTRLSIDILYTIYYNLYHDTMHVQNKYSHIFHCKYSSKIISIKLEPVLDVLRTWKTLLLLNIYSNLYFTVRNARQNVAIEETFFWNNKHKTVLAMVLWVSAVTWCILWRIYII